MKENNKKFFEGWMGKHPGLYLMGVLILALWFSWTQIRPAYIKHECSWIKMHDDAVPALTQAEIDKDNQAKKSCDENYPGTSLQSGSALFGALLNSSNCTSVGEHAGESPHDAIPAKDYYVEASTEGYNFCLHDKGL